MEKKEKIEFKEKKEEETPMNQRITRFNPNESPKKKKTTIRITRNDANIKRKLF